MRLNLGKTRLALREKKRFEISSENTFVYSFTELFTDIFLRNTLGLSSYRAFVLKER